MSGEERRSRRWLLAGLDSLDDVADGTIHGQAAWIPALGHVLRKGTPGLPISAPRRH
jgi:hypothetical protein